MSDPEVVKKRFDDAYRTLLAASGIFAFAFSNYAMAQFSTFIYKIGIPFVLTAVAIWSISHIVHQRWEYQVKFIGIFLAWFAVFGLLSIVYLKNLVGSIVGLTGWLIIDFLVSLSIVPVVGSLFVSTGIITKRYLIFMTACATFISLIAYFLVSM